MGLFAIEHGLHPNSVSMIHRIMLTELYDFRAGANFLVVAMNGS